MSLGENVKKIRKEMGLSQEKFGEKIGISRSYVGEIECGKIKGGANLLNALSKATGKPVSFFISGDSIDDVDLKPYEVLDLAIDKFIDNGMICDGPIPFNSKTEEILLDILKQEIKFKFEKRKEQKWELPFMSESL